MTLCDHADPGVPAGGGDADLSAVGAVLADRSRCKILLALADGRALRPLVRIRFDFKPA
jgi:hypothetical protein